MDTNPTPRDPDGRRPWQSDPVQYEAMWRLDADREKRRPRRAALLLAGVLVLAVGIWAGYLAAGRGDGPPWPYGVAPSDGVGPAASPAGAPEASDPGTAVVPGGSDVLATTIAGPHPGPATCPDSTNPAVPGPPDQPRPRVTGWFGWVAAFHEPSAQMIVLDSSSWSRVAAWAFDVCANTWRELAEPPRDVGSVQGLSYDADSQLLVAFGQPSTGDAAWSTWAWSLETGAWSPGSAEMPRAAQAGAGVPVYDPASGLVLVRDGDSGELWAYDVDADDWAQVRQVGDVPLGFGATVYDSRVDELALIRPSLLGPQGDRVDIWRLNPRSGRWTHDWSASRVPLMVPWPNAIAVDARSGITVIVGQAYGLVGQGARFSQVIGYEPGYIEPMFIGTDEGVAHCTTSAIAYDSVNGRVVCAGGVRYTFDAQGRPVGIEDVSDVAAFDVARRAWVRLLEP